jgi:predicted dienelactone hydrolase
MRPEVAHRNATPPLLRGLCWASLVLRATTALATTGLSEIPGQQPDQEPVVVFYPSEAKGPPLQRWQFTLPVVEGAAPARGNGRLVVISHGSPSNPWVNADLAIALTQAGFVVAVPWHLRDNSSDSRDSGPVSWKRRPLEVSAAVDTVLADARFAPLLAADRVGAYGMSAGGHTVLTLAGGRWSPSALRDHCLAHLEDDFVTCVGPTTARLTGGWLDEVKLAVARWVIGWKMDDPTWYGHTDVRIAAVVAGVPLAADFDPATLATPRVPLGLITARKDVWLVPRFHGEAAAKSCARCEWLADIAEGGHGALLSPQPRREGRIAELVGDPPGFDRATEVPAVIARVVDFFRRQLLP